MSATPLDLTDYLTPRELSIGAETPETLLINSLDFIGTLSFCEEVPDDVLIKAQCALAYAMSITGGGFNPNGIVDGRILIEEGLGRSAIIDKYTLDDGLVGNDSLTQLKRVGVIYGMLKPYLCKEECDDPCSPNYTGTRYSVPASFAV